MRQRRAVILIFQFALFQVLFAHAYVAAERVSVAGVSESSSSSSDGSIAQPTITELTPAEPGALSRQQDGPLEWCGYPGNTLRGTLQTWATTAEWTLQWRFPHDYPISITTCFQGDFTQALQQLAQAYRKAERPFYLDLYPKQRLLVVSS